MEEKKYYDKLSNDLSDQELKNLADELSAPCKPKTDSSVNVDQPVKPACDVQILQAKIDENEYWLKFLNADASNIIHKSSLIDRVKFLENENRKSV